MPLASQAQVNYRPADAPDHRCATCANFLPPQGCSRVVPPIDPNGVCDLYEPRMAAPMAYGSIPARTPPIGGMPAAPAKPSGNDHPRMHALTIAAATHLHKAGHLPAAKKAQIHAKAKANLKRLKGKAKEPEAFGSLAPDYDEDGQ